MTPWTFSNIAPSVWHRWRLDGAEVFLWNCGHQWRWAAFECRPESRVPGFGGPETVELSNLVVAEVCYAPPQPVALRPWMMNRPFAVTLATTTAIHRDDEAVFTVDLPVSVRFELKSGAILGTPNTIRLAKTWFGDTTTGFPCFYWPVEPSVVPQRPLPSMVRCTVRIQNHAKTVLNVKQFALYSELLTLWRDAEELVTNDVVLEGLADGNLRMRPEPRADREALELLHSASVGQTELLIQRGVGFLRNIAGIS